MLWVGIPHSSFVFLLKKDLCRFFGLAFAKQFNSCTFILNLDIIGSLFTPVCSGIQSESSLWLSAALDFFTLALCCV